MNKQEMISRVVRNMTAGNKTLDMKDYGVWAVYGEDPNCDFGGYHHNPFIGTVEGTLEDAIEHAVTMPGFWGWGSGGHLKKTTTAIVSQQKEPKPFDLRKELKEAMDKIDSEQRPFVGKPAKDYYRGQYDVMTWIYDEMFGESDD